MIETALVLTLAVAGVSLALGVLILGIRTGQRFRRHAGLGVAALVAVLVVASVGRDAYAAGSGTDSWGQLKVDYFTDGTTLISARQKGQVFLYAVLTSAQTTELRAIYTTAASLPLADGGQTPTAVDGTATFPSCAPHLGDLTD